MKKTARPKSAVEVAVGKGTVNLGWVDKSMIEYKSSPHQGALVLNFTATVLQSLPIHALAHVKAKQYRQLVLVANPSQGQGPKLVWKQNRTACTDVVHSVQPYTAKGRSIKF